MNRLIYVARRNTYLVEFNRGCLVDKIFALTEADVAELKSLGESPGSRN